MTTSEVEQSLRDAIAWTAYVVKTTPLMPRKQSFIDRLLRREPAPPYPKSYWSNEFGVDGPAKCSMEHPVVERFDEVIQKRRQYLALKNIAFPNSGSELAKGRLLISCYRESTFDTGPNSVSAGLFDEGDIPTWDSWVSLREGPHGTELIAWIPDAWMWYADIGVEAAPLSNILWVDSVPEDYGDLMAMQMRIKNR